MDPLELLSHLRALGIVLEVKDSDLICLAEPASLTASLRADIKSNKIELLNILRAEEKSSLTSAFKIKRSEIENPPLSFSQQRLWFLDQLEGGTTRTYNMPFAVRFFGHLDRTVLQQSLDAIFNRHDSLRTSFRVIKDEPRQVIADTGSCPFEFLDLSGLVLDKKESEVLERINEASRKPFDLGKGPLVRSILVKVASDEHVFAFICHHIISDGWSVGIFKRELSDLYRSYQNGEEATLTDLPIQFGDYAVWQRKYLRGSVLDNELTHWQERLSGDSPPLHLPTDRIRPRIQSHNGTSHAFLLDRNLTDRVKSLCKAHDVTLFMGLLTAFNVLLSRYSSQNDISIGTAVANRTRMEIEPLIGFFVNTLVLRNDLSGNPTFATLLKRVRNVVLESYDHQDIPFETLVAELQPERSTSRSPLFQVLFLFQNTPEADFDIPGIKEEPFLIPGSVSKFEMTLSFAETTEGLQGAIRYNTDLFDQDRIDRLTKHYGVLLKEITEDPLKPIADINIFTQPEIDELGRRVQATRRSYPLDKYVHELFEQQVKKTPSATAVVFRNDEITYDALNRRANAIANNLLAGDAMPGDLIGISTVRSLELPAAVLGIWKAGCAYVPLDPAAPAARLSEIIDDCRPVLILTNDTHQELFSGLAKRVLTFQDIPDAGTHSRAPTQNELSPSEKISHVIYTSGTTGKPKGVVGHHRGIVNFIFYLMDEHNLNERDIVIQLPSLSFDASIRDLIGPLLCGARTVLVPPEGATDPKQLLDIISAQRVTKILSIVPTVLSELVDEASRHNLSAEQLDLVLVSGEPLHYDLCSRAARFLVSTGEIVNNYGSTECTMVQTFYRWSPDDTDVDFLPAGRPISNHAIFVCDENLNPVPTGIPGEVCVTGVGLAQGYHNLIELTQNHFADVDLPNVGSVRLYRTGDTGRIRADGQLVLHGRIDNQVKIGGIRIELGELESLLERHPSVESSVVLFQADRSGPNRLVAYVCQSSSEPSDSESLRDHLATYLPHFLIPRQFFFLDHFPTNTSGKVDRKRLRLTEFNHVSDSTHPKRENTSTESMLQQIWAEVLSYEKPEIDDNFFDLGGHSMLALRLFSRITEKVGRPVSVSTIFDAPTIRELGQRLDKAQPPSTCGIVSIRNSGEERPLFLLPGLGGHVLGFNELTKFVRSTRPVFASPAPGLEEKELPLDSMSEIAAYHIRQIKSIQPDGPYALLGYSYGGVVAFAIASRLKADGEEVDFLGVLDSSPPNDLSHLNLLHQVFRRCRQAILRRGNAAVLKCLKLFNSAFSAVAADSGKSEDEEEFDDLLKLVGYKATKKSPSTRLLAVINANMMARKSFVPVRFEGPFVLFRAEHQGSRLKYSRYFSRSRWNDFAPEITEVEIPGRHLNLLKTPNAESLARKINQLLPVSVSPRNNGTPDRADNQIPRPRPLKNRSPNRPRRRSPAINPEL